MTFLSIPIIISNVQIYGEVAQLARASGSYPAGQRFESTLRYQINKRVRKNSFCFEKEQKMAIQILLIIVGFLMLIKGADILVDGSSAIAKKLRISEIVIGLTIVSIGTSMPEMFVSTASALKGSSDISIGNVIGSNICNLLLILGVSALIHPVKFQKQTKLIENPMSIILTIIFLIMCNINQDISRIEGIILLTFFIAFITYTVIMGKKTQDEEIVKTSLEEAKKISVVKNVLFILLGIIGLKIGGDLVVNNAKLIATALNISEKIIGLTIVAIGTSLPELVTSVTAALKGESDIAIGNIVGSNIFNLLFIIGLSAVITPITYNISYNFDMIILFVAMILMLIFPFIKPKDEMSRTNGAIFTILYIIYMMILILKK